LASCGGPALTKVTGTVKYKDKPVSNATVIFVPDAGGVQGAATTDGNGKYTMGCNLGVGVPPGAYSVKIKSQVKPLQEGSPTSGMTPGSAEYAQAYQNAMRSSHGKNAYKTTKDPDAIPEKYDSGAELKAAVENSGSQEINFELK
jgi:hypothetical protein